MKKQYIYILLLSLLSSSQLWSQQEADLYLTAEHTQGIMIVKWQPVRPTLWDSLNIIGYTVERTELDELGNPKTATKTIVQSNIMPKDSSWFNAHEDDYFGTMGMLLYDSTFQFAKNDLIDATKMRYDYLLHEARLQWQEPSLALGLAIEDTSMVDGLLYQYRVFAQQNGRIIAEEIVDMDAESGLFAGKRPIPEGAFDFNFHGGESLIDMSGKLKELQVDQIFMNAKPMGDSIILRWAPNNANFWQRSMKAGYRIVRIEMVDDALSDIRKAFDLIIAKQETELDASIASDSMSLVAAQVMFGNVAGAATASIYDQGGLYQNRFGMALYAAERSAMAADILGFRLVDRNVELGKKYTYFIESDASFQPIHGDILQVENIPVPDPAPVDFVAEAGDGAVILSWNKASNDQNFSTYQIEKSTDGQTWTALSSRPIMILEDESSPVDDYRFIDSAVVNYQKYIYRLRGYTAFAELGAPTDVTVMPKDLTPPPLPIIIAGALSEDESQIDIKWALNDVTPPDLVGYHVILNDAFEGLGDTISEFLPATANTFTYVLPDSVLFNSHYFKIAAIDTAGNTVISFPHFVMVPDKYPPLPPPNIYGHVDSVGIVTLVWDHSPSQDVTNYHVLFSNHPEAEFSVLTKVEPLEENIFYDTLSLRAMDEYVYYVVLAEDQSYLRSEASNILELKRPDVIPPIKPILRKPTQEADGLKLVWLPSPSADCVGHEIYRRLFQTDAAWELITEVDTLTTSWTDETTELEVLYEYSMRAKDDVNLYSEYCFPQKQKRQFTGENIKVQNLQAIYNEDTKKMDLQWQYEEPTEKPAGLGNYYFYVYKSYGALELELAYELEGNTLQISDEEVSTGAIHNYAVMVVYENGLMGSMSEAVSVQPEEG